MRIPPDLTHRSTPPVRPTPRPPLISTAWLRGAGLALLLIATVLPPATAQAGTAGTLGVDRTRAVAGWWLTFRGHAPTARRQQIVLQRYLNGGWHDRVTTATDTRGAFAIHFRQLGMPREHYRVKGPGFVTRQVTVDAINQAVDLHASNTDPAAGQTFTLYAQVTPAEQGRSVKFFRASSTRKWDLLGQVTTDARGGASLQVTGPGRYRALAGRDHGGCAYPSLVITLPAASLTEHSVSDPQSTVVLSPQPSSAHFSAEKLFSWWPAGERWEWVSGEGTRHWATYQAGSGHVATLHGGFTLLSGSYDNQVPSYGTTAATLSTKGHRYGRWEMRTKLRVYGRATYTPYTAELRLVRAGTGFRSHPDNVITIATWRGFAGRTDHTVTRKQATYGFTSFGTARNNTNHHNYAVELTRRHLTWLVDGQVVATAPAGMVPDRRWVPQFVLRGRQGQRMTASRLGSDWVRYFPLSSSNALDLPVGPTPTLRG